MMPYRFIELSIMTEAVYHNTSTVREDHTNHSVFVGKQSGTQSVRQ